MESYILLTEKLEEAKQMSNGRTKSDKDIKTAYQAATMAQGRAGGRSISSQALSYLYNIAKGAVGQGMMGGAKPKKKKSPAMKWSPKGGKGMKKGGKVKRKR